MGPQKGCTIWQIWWSTPSSLPLTPTHLVNILALKVEFDVPIGKNGDCYDRYLCRVQEFRESLRIINQVSMIQEARNLRKVGAFSISAWTRSQPDPSRLTITNWCHLLVHQWRKAWSLSFTTSRQFTFASLHEFRLFKQFYRYFLKDTPCLREKRMRPLRLQKAKWPFTWFRESCKVVMWLSPTFLLSDGTNRPYRCSIRAPGFAHLAGADFMSRSEHH